MSFPGSRSLLPMIAAAGLGAILASCSGNGGSSPSVYSNPQPANSYGLLNSITFANFPIATPPGPGGATVSSFDISFIDPSVNQYYVADRDNSGVSVVNTTTQTYVLTAGAGKFQGFKPNGASGPATNAGPNGIVPVGNGVVFAGDGDSTLKVVNVNTGALLATVPAVNPYVGVPLPATCGGAGTPTVGAANQRLDEMAYDPADGVVLAINDAACPPFGTFFSSTAPYNAVGSIAFTTASGGAEQPTYDPAQKLFIEALPQTLAHPNGEVDLIDPRAHTVVQTFGMPTDCEPNGTALGQNETLFLGCSATGEILTINATNGAVLNTIAGFGGCDEVWYNPSANRFYAACSNNTSGPVFVVADGSGNLIKTVATSTGAHSIAVDPTADRVYLPTQKLGLQVYAH